MKTLGIVGGIGPESTIEYYRSIIAEHVAHYHDGSYPPVLINSINLKKLLDLVEAREHTRVTEFLVAELLKLASAGADLALVAANTPHIVFDELRDKCPIPLVSIVEATCEAARTLGLKRVGLFGTTFTMQGGFYQSVFSKQGVALIVPEQEEQAYIHDKYLNDLVKGIILPETRAGLLAIVDRMIKDDAMDGLILGGTELPLILKDTTYRGIPFLDTTKIHVKSAVTRLWSLEASALG